MVREMMWILSIHCFHPLGEGIFERERGDSDRRAHHNCSEKTTPPQSHSEIRLLRNKAENEKGPKNGFASQQKEPPLMFGNGSVRCLRCCCSL